MEASGVQKREPILQREPVREQRKLNESSIKISGIKILSVEDCLRDCFDEYMRIETFKNHVFDEFGLSRSEDPRKFMGSNTDLVLANAVTFDNFYEAILNAIEKCEQHNGSVQFEELKKSLQDQVCKDTFGCTELNGTLYIYSLHFSLVTVGYSVTYSHRPP